MNDLGSVILSNFISAIIVGGIYVFIVSLVTITNKPNYSENIKTQLRETNNLRWMFTSVVFLVLSFLIPFLLFSIFWTPRNYSKVNPYVLNIGSLIIAAVIAHIIYHIMKTSLINKEHIKSGERNINEQKNIY